MVNVFQALTVVGCRLSVIGLAVKGMLNYLVIKFNLNFWLISI